MAATALRWRVSRILVSHVAGMERATAELWVDLPYLECGTVGKYAAIALFGMWNCRQICRNCLIWNSACL